MAKMSKKQKVLARHALGLPNPQRRSYRNRFLVAEGAAGPRNGMASRSTVSRGGFPATMAACATCSC